MKKDTRIFDLIAAERSRQMHGIELIASENFVSDQVMEAMGSVLTNKYAEFCCFFHDFVDNRYRCMFSKKAKESSASTGGGINCRKQT